jgi:hypothetical protein
MVRAPFIFHIIPQYGSLGLCGLPWDLVQTPRGLCNNNSFIYKHDVMIRSSVCFLMSFLSFDKRTLANFEDLFILGVNYPNYPFF